VISGLHHYALEVPDLAVAEDFLQDFGLETGEKDGALIARCPGRDQEQVRLVPAQAKRLHHVSFTVRPGTLDTLRDSLDRAGTPVIEPPRGAPARSQQMTDFYTQVLGLAVSDRIRGLVTFLNAGPGDHHIFGFIASSHPGFHHASFEVPSIDAIAIGADRMHAKGREAGWGLGRHTIGSNFFHYNPDPWGSWTEWFSDIDQIDDCWVARDWEVPPHLWGAPPPDTFLANHEPAS